jgi:type I restriction enzyme S subunit
MTEESSHGTKRLPGHVFEQLAIPVPSLSEQRRIADILDKADTIRRKRKEAIALTDMLLRSAFVEIFGDPVTNPKGWPVTTLGELADIASGVTKGKKYEGVTTVSVPYMRVANVQDGHLVLDDVTDITVSEEEARRYLLRSGDVLLTEGGDPDKLGRGAVWRGGIVGCIHQNHIFRVRGSETVLPEYLSALLGSQRGKRYFLRAAKQTTGIASINMTQLKGFPALVPPRSVQKRYVELLARARVTREHQEAAANELDALFGALVERAFRGELPGRGAARVARGARARSDTPSPLP